MGDGAAAGRGDRRAGGRADHRRHALLPVHRGEVQSRRHPTAVLGAGRLRFPCRAQARPTRALAPARLRLRQRAVGKIFRRRLGGALRAVSHFRPRRAPRLGDTRALARADCRAGYCRAPCRLAVPDRFSAARLCRASCGGCARLVRPYLAPGRIRRQPDFLPAAVVFHCRAAAVADSPPPCGEGLGVGVAR